MYTAIDSKGGRQHGGSIYCLYFVLLTLCGDYTLLNVFLAIACDSLDQAAALNEVRPVNQKLLNLSLIQLIIPCLYDGTKCRDHNLGTDCQ